MFQANVAALLLCAAVCRGFLGETKTTVGVVSYRGHALGRIGVIQKGISFVLICFIEIIVGFFGEYLSEVFFESSVRR